LFVVFPSDKIWLGTGSGVSCFQEGETGDKTDSQTVAFIVVSFLMFGVQALA